MSNFCLDFDSLLKAVVATLSSLMIMIELCIKQKHVFAHSYTRSFRYAQIANWLIKFDQSATIKQTPLLAKRHCIICNIKIFVCQNTMRCQNFIDSRSFSS